MRTARAHPLSVVVDDAWYRLVEPPSDPDVLVVTDGVALTFSAEPFRLDDEAADLVDEIDQMAQAIVNEEGFRPLESWDGTVVGLPMAERVLVRGEGEGYCVLSVLHRDGYRIVARGDSLAEFGDRDVVGELRRVAASLRAAGDRRGAAAAVTSSSDAEETS